MEIEIVKVQRLSNTVRVVLERCKDGRYRIAAQQQTSGYNPRWETQEDGWRDTQARYSPTLEGARREFDAIVRGEQRWLETIGR